jgi:hypothetical protein
MMLIEILILGIALAALPFWPSLADRIETFVDNKFPSLDWYL